VITCDVPRCENERIMSWRPIGHPRGYRVCRRHAGRDHDPQDPFDLFAVFGLSRMHQRIQAEANRKRSEAAKRRARRGNGTFEPASPEVAQNEQQVDGDIGDKDRHCACGEPLAKGKRYCDQCRAERRRATMRTYMQNRRGSPAQPTASVRSRQKATGASASRRTDDEPPSGRLPSRNANFCITKPA
jgi:hypothetical protein